MHEAPGLLPDCVDGVQPPCLSDLHLYSAIRVVVRKICIENWQRPAEFRTYSQAGHSKYINEFVEGERDAGARAREVSKGSKRCNWVLDPSEGTWKRRVMDAVSCETTASDEWDRVREKDYQPTTLLARSESV